MGGVLGPTFSPKGPSEGNGQHFRRVRGYKDMNRLIAALARIEQEQEEATISRSRSTMNGVAAH